jgi:SAM-dependent methyltransferase
VTATFEPMLRHDRMVTFSVLSPHTPGPVLVPSRHSQTVPLYRLPVVAELGGLPIVCDNLRLPFRTGSLGSISCEAALEYLIDDRALLDEVARILAVGGRLALAVPNALGLGRLDGLNAARYLRDITGRGKPAAELIEAGWRRHYRPDELQMMLNQAGFGNIRIASTGTGIQEIRAFAGAIRGSRFGRESARVTCHANPEDMQGVPAHLGARIVATAVQID